MYAFGRRAIHVIFLPSRWVHCEPWNQDARYLLVLAIFQKAHEEKYPKHTCVILKKLIMQVLSNISNPHEKEAMQYQVFLLLLLSSEVCLQSLDYENCITEAKEALKLTPSSRVDTFFANLQLCRAYVVHGDLLNSRNEYMKCLRNHTNTEIGWVMLKQLESACSLEGFSDEIDIKLHECVKRNGSDSSKWTSLFNLACAQCFLWGGNFESAEKALAQACSQVDPDSCILFLNG